MKIHKYEITIFFTVIFVSLVFGSMDDYDLQAKHSDVEQKIKSDTLIYVKANPKSGFNFDYLLLLPKGLEYTKKQTLLVETNNSGSNDSLSYHLEEAKKSATRTSIGNYISRSLKIPFLVPVFPRSKTDWQYYTHALDRDSFLSTNSEIERLDLQLIAMIEDAKYQLKKYHIVTNKKVFITGFSASGTFANRFSVLHPKKVIAVAVGGINAMPILPIKKLDTTKLCYPIGISDIKEITRKRINLKSFKELPQMIYMGELDSNDAVAFGDAYSDYERTIIYTKIGEKMMPDRWEIVKKIYLSNNVNVTFKTYPNIGHNLDASFFKDIVMFFYKYL